MTVQEGGHVEVMEIACVIRGTQDLIAVSQ